MFSEKDLIFPLSDLSLQDIVSGGFKRRILVLKSSDSGSGPNHTFLSKVLSAARINLEQDTLFAEYPAQTFIPVSPTLRSKQPEFVLVFGLKPSQLCLALQPPQYQPLDFYGATWLWADSLSQIEDDKDKKTQLWRALQVVFL